MVTGGRHCVLAGYACGTAYILHEARACAAWDSVVCLLSEAAAAPLHCRASVRSIDL